MTTQLRSENSCGLLDTMGRITSSPQALKLVSAQNTWIAEDKSHLNSSTPKIWNPAVTMNSTSTTRVEHCTPTPPCWKFFCPVPTNTRSRTLAAPLPASRLALGGEQGGDVARLPRGRERAPHPHHHVHALPRRADHVRAKGHAAAGVPAPPRAHSIRFLRRAGVEGRGARNRT